MAGIVFVDGEYVAPEDARMSIFDAGFTYGDTVYDVTSAWNGYVFKLDEHLERLQRSCDGFRLTNPHTTGETREIIGECMARSELDDAYIKVEVTRGVIPKHGRDLREARQRLVAYALPYIWIWSEEKCRNGSSIHLSRRFERVSSRAVDARFKNYNRADMVQARLDAYECGCDDALLVGVDGSVTEGFGWNLLIVRDGAVATPADNVLEGMTRESVAEICEAEAIPYEQRRVWPYELEEADEIFAATTAGGVMPIIALDGTAVGSGSAGPITRRIQDLYWSKRTAGWHGTAATDLVGATA
ncbi:MAG: aminotransferase class IV [Gaiellales bacterium]